MKTPLILIIVLLFTSPVWAKVNVTERTKTYTISGKNGQELSRSIVKKGLKAVNTRHAIATTQTRLRIRNVKTAIRRNRCVVTDVDVDLSLTYTYPRWVDRNKASPRIRKAWDKFYAQVVRHEEQHGRIAKDFARDVSKLVKRASGRVSRDCKDFGLTQRRKLERAASRSARRHARFDRREGRAFSRVRRLQRSLLRAQ
ncbi:MAG: DUF922 domain-containing protein [Pseudomonadota bacterium]